MKENLRILMVEPQKAPYEASVPHELTAMQQAVGGLIEVVRNGDGTLLVCNEEGKLLGMEGNRRIPGDVLAGPFFVVGDAGETFRSLTEEELEDQGIKPNTIRLSIGTENIDDIIQDLDEAFKAIQ